MSKFWVLLLLSQYAHIVICAKDSHMCIKDVEVNYTVTERVPLEAYEDFASVLRNLDVLGEMKVVVCKYSYIVVTNNLSNIYYMLCRQKRKSKPVRFAVRATSFQ